MTDEDTATDGDDATEALEDYDSYRETDVLVIGSGIAGLAAALGAARELEQRESSERASGDGGPASSEGADVTVATKATRPEGASSWWAQGGIAVSRDDPGQFKEDILTASADTADPGAVDVLVDEANEAVQDVLVDTLGVDFDTGEEGDGYADGDADGRSAEGDEGDADWDFGREAAHDEARILHVDASTGKHIHVPFLNHLDAHDGVTIRDDTAALELISHEGRIHGALLERDDEVTPTFAGSTVLATGGIGDLYPRSTNPDGSTGDGIAMAALAGADVDDMEYVQFHPTVYPGSEAGSASKRSGEAAEQGDGDGDVDGPFLVSEAVRGEGAVLRNGEVSESVDSEARETQSPGGERFMPDYHEDAELAPRDVVARAVQKEREAARRAASNGASGGAASSDATGEVVLDVSPLDFADEFPDLAAKCEERGVDWESGIPVGPAEHFLCGGVAVDDHGRTSLDRLYAVGECSRTGVHGANRLASTSLLEGLVWGLRAGEDAAGKEAEIVEAPELLDRDPDLPDNFASEKFVRLRRVMDEYVGLRRHPEDLARAQAVLRRLKGEVDAYVRTRTSRSLYELRHASVTALLVTRAAAENEESVGTHNVVEKSAESGAD